jgi:hypothetical protein
MLDANGGNAILSIGRYNGWGPGLTVDSATRARWSGHCRNQNNLDYLTQFLNGYLQGKDGHTIGSYCMSRTPLVRIEQMADFIGNLKDC